MYIYRHTHSFGYISVFEGQGKDHNAKSGAKIFQSFFFKEILTWGTPIWADADSIRFE